MGSVLNIAWLLLFLYTGSGLLTFIQNFIMATVTQKISKAMRSDISQKLNRLPLKYFDQSSYGDVLSRVTNDVDTIGQTMNRSIASLITAVAMFLGTLLMMFYTNWILALTAVVTSIVGFFIMIFIMKRSQKYFLAQQVNLGSINGHIEEIFSGHNVVKVYNGSKQARETFE